VHIIQSVDRKLSLDDVAAARGISFGELIEEMEAIVYSGTRLDIRYYLNDNIDEEIQDEIIDYFKQAETDSMSVALEELGDDEIDETTLRLVRLRFISEYAN
jgi:ATP-dependent DNA helicase RecQ